MHFPTLVAVAVAVFSIDLTVATEAHKQCVTVTETVTVDSCETAPPVMPPPNLVTSSGYLPPVEPSGSAPPTVTGEAPPTVTVSQSGEVPSTVVPGIPPTTVLTPPVGTSTSTIDTSLPSPGSTTRTASKPTPPISSGPHGSGTPTTTAPAQEITNAAPMLGLDFGGMGIVAAGVFLNAAVALVA